MALKAEALIRLKFQSIKKLTALVKALKPEVNLPTARRANVKLSKEGSFLVLTVEADDTVALRATLNAYLRWMGSLVNVMDLLEQASS